MARAPSRLGYNKKLIPSRSYIFIIFYSSFFFFFLNGVEYAFPVGGGITPAISLQKYLGPNP